MTMSFLSRVAITALPAGRVHSVWNSSGDGANNLYRISRTLPLPGKRLALVLRVAIPCLAGTAIEPPLPGKVLTRVVCGAMVKGHGGIRDAMESASFAPVISHSMRCFFTPQEMACNRHATSTDLFESDGSISQVTDLPPPGWDHVIRVLSCEKRPPQRRPSRCLTASLASSLQGSLRTRVSLPVHDGTRVAAFPRQQPAFLQTGQTRPSPTALYCAVACISSP